jgi:hypothetical protein
VTKDGFVPANEAAASLHAKFNEGWLVDARFPGRRSLPMHNLYWAVIDKVAKAKGMSEDELHNGLKIARGLYDICKMPNGKIALATHSSSFDNMNNEEFTAFATFAFDAICRDIFKGTITVEELLMETINAPKAA